MKRYNRIQNNAMLLMEGTDALKWDNQVILWSRAAGLRTVAVRPVLAVLDCDLLVRMVLVIHMTLVVLGMLVNLLACRRQLGTGIHLELDKVKMQGQDTLPPPGNLDRRGRDTEVGMDSRNVADIQVARRKQVVTDIQVVMTDNDLTEDIQVVYYQDHRVVGSVFADTVGRREDSMSSTMRL